MPFDDTRRRIFPDAVPLPEFADSTRAALAPHGFTEGNSLLLLGACRDELSAPLITEMQQRWGWAFGVGGLAGMPFLGKTGVLAASHHVPDGEGVKRHVVVLTTHIGIDEDGTVGQCRREGQVELSSACGALVAFRNELGSGRAVTQMDPDDPEMSLLRLRLLREIPYGTVPSLEELTRTVRTVLEADFRRVATALFEDGPAMTALVSAITIHGPRGDWIDAGPLELATPEGVNTLTLS